MALRQEAAVLLVFNLMVIRTTLSFIYFPEYLYPPLNMINEWLYRLSADYLVFSSRIFVVVISMSEGLPNWTESLSEFIIIRNIR